METIKVKPGPRYQAVVPKAVRAALDRRPGDSIVSVIQADDDVRKSLRIFLGLRRCPASFTEAMRGLHRKLWGDPDRWLEQERFSWES